MGRHLKDLLLTSSDVEDQLRKLVDNKKLTGEDERLRNDTCDYLMILLSHYFKKCRIHQFGSSINGFGFQDSDLDLFLDYRLEDASAKCPKVAADGEIADVRKVQVPPLHGFWGWFNKNGRMTAEQFESLDVREMVKLLAKIIGQCGKSRFTSIQPIPGNRVQLVKMIDKQTGMSCDLVLNSRNALYNSRLLRLYSTNPVVRQVVMAVRFWAQRNHICHESTNTISSYALTLMVFFFLMRRHPPVIPQVWDLIGLVEGLCISTVKSWKTLIVPMDARLPPTQNKETAVHLLSGFFQFYAHEIVWETSVLLMSSAQIISHESYKKQFPDKKPKSDRQAGLGCMSMLDPFDLSHNVLRRVNEKSKYIFMEEVKRAASLSLVWQDSPSDLRSKVNPWGVATLFIPDPPFTPFVGLYKARPGKSKRRKYSQAAMTNNKKKKDNFFPSPEESSHFVINFSPKSTDTLAGNSEWCHSVQKLLENILRTVLVLDVKLKDINVTCDNSINKIVEKDELSPGIVHEQMENEDTGQPIPWEISLDESPVLGKVTGEKGSGKEVKEHNVKSNAPPKEMTDKAYEWLSENFNLPCSPASGIDQSISKTKVKGVGVLSAPSHEESGSCEVTMGDRLIGATSPDPSHLSVKCPHDETSAKPILRVKRSSTVACLDKLDPVSESNPEQQLTSGEHSEMSSSQGQTRSKSSPKPVEKKVRLHGTEGDKEEAAMENCSSQTVSGDSEAHLVFEPSLIPMYDINPALENFSSHPMEGCENVRKTTYFCICTHPVWRERQKFVKLVKRSGAFYDCEGLALESEVTRCVIEAQEQFRSHEAKKTRLMSLKKVDGAKQKSGQTESHSFDSGKESKAVRVPLSSSPPSSSSSSVSSPWQTIQFFCTITEKRFSDNGLPQVDIIFQTLFNQSKNNVKKIYTCVEPIMKQLVASSSFNERCIHN